MALRTFADGALFAETFGNSGKPRVLALHGWGRRGADFKRSLADIPSLAPDLPGFGASPPPSEVMGARGYADAVLPVLEDFSQPPVVVGHSFGGRVAVCLAARHPEKVGPLLLTGAPLVRASPPTRPSAVYRLLRWLHNTGVIGDDRMEEIRRKRGSADYRAASGVMRSILVEVINESYEDELKSISAPISMLWGADDAEVPVVVARSAKDIVEAAGRTSVELEVVQGVGHHLPIEAPDRLRASVESMLR